VNANRLVRAAALAVAVGVAGWLILTKPPAGSKPPEAAPSGPPPLTRTWPNAAVVTVAGELPDGTAYTPWLYVNANVSVGTAPTPDNSAHRVLLRVGSGAPVELRQVPANRFPQFLGFVAAGDDVYWAEATASLDGPSETRVLRASWKTPAPAATVTTDAGSAVFFNSQFDLVVADGAVHWVASAPTDTPVTELRSVPVGGGAVTTRRLDGAFQLSTWPWLLSAEGNNAPISLFNPVTNQTVQVPTSATELVGCTPAWCRSLVSAPSGAVLRFDVMRPDGSDRRRVAGATASAATSDVGFLDRFEILTEGDSAAQNLILYDIQARRLATVAERVGMVLARGGMLWWSTGEQEATQWHTLDLRTLLT
jgi:hypothetical protein